MARIARIARITGGIIVVLLGIVMLVTPGPGVITVAAGVLLLARDIPAAERLVEWARGKLARRSQTGEAAGESDPA